MRIISRTSAVFVVGLVAAVLTVSAQRAAKAPPGAASPADATGRIVAAAQAFLATLDDAGRTKVQTPFDVASRTKWSNLPVSPSVPRLGLRMGDLNPAQRAAAEKLLQTALSADGYRKVNEIMLGDEVLRTRGRGSTIFGKDEYYLAFLNPPSTATPWMLQFGGHHLAINLTMAGRQASMTPSLPATQPATFTIEGREIRPLGDENDKGFALINALDDAQRSQAVLNYRVSNLVLGPGQDGRVIEPEGIRASSLSPKQQEMLLDLVREWAGIMTDAFGEPRMAEIRANLANTYFAWSGPTAPGSLAYFRVQGPTLVIEYAPQGNVDHIHTIYRDPTNDYGAKFTAK